MEDQAKARGRRTKGGAATATAMDVARHLGISQATVSRAFTPGTPVSEKLRARVKEAAQELGYRPNALARGLISGRSNLVAMLISGQTNLLYPELIYELTERLADQAYHLLLFTVDGDRSLAEVIDQIWSHQVDAVLATGILGPEYVQQFERHGVPLIMFNRVLPQPVSTVYCDFYQGSRQLVARLIEAGHRSFGLLSGPDDSFAGEEALRGAQEVLSNAGITKTAVSRQPYGYEAGEAGIRDIQQSLGIMPDAIFCVNELAAIGCIDQLRVVYGLDVPGDVSVASFGVAKPSQWLGYRLTMMRQPVERMVAATIQLFSTAVDHPEAQPERRVFFGEFVRGATARLEPLPPSASKRGRVENTA